MKFNCNLCENQTNEKFTFSGSRNADVMLVLPCAEKGCINYALSVAHKKMLEDMLDIFDVDLDNCYMTTLIKCEAPFDEKRAENCINHLRTQFKRVRPNMIVCFGEKVSRMLISSDFTLFNDHGKVFQKNGVFFFGTYEIKAAFDDTDIRAAMLKDFMGLRQSERAT